MNPIIRRELLEVLRTRKALGLQLGLALGCAALVLVRWPTGGLTDLDGTRSLHVLRVFGYGLLAAVLLLVPAFPATALVREKARGTLALLLNSPMRPWRIYAGKLGGVLGFAGVLLAVTLPAAAACDALGGTTVRGGVALLYAVLGMAALQLATLGLWVSSRSQSADGALRATYALVLAVCILPLGPYAMLHGGSDAATEVAGWVRCLSPLPAVMEVLGHGDVGTQGLAGTSGAVGRYALLAAATALVCALATVRRLDYRLFDRARPAGVMTQDLPAAERVGRRLLFLVDPQRRSGGMTLWVNPVMVKEFRARRFGRWHWTLRLIAVSAVLALALSYLASTGAVGVGLEFVGAGLVLLQVTLLVLFTPSLAAGLVSAERETGSWQLLRMTPLRAGTILRGKLLSVAWPVLLLLGSTLPAYIVLMMIEPELAVQIRRVVACLVLLAVFAVLLSAAVSTLFRSTAVATTTAYLLLLAVCVAPLLVWLGREAPFGRATVETALAVSPVAAALQAADTPGFMPSDRYELAVMNAWLVGGACLVLLVFLRVRIGQLYRPE